MFRPPRPHPLFLIVLSVLMLLGVVVAEATTKVTGVSPSTIVLDQATVLTFSGTDIYTGTLIRYIYPNTSAAQSQSYCYTTNTNQCTITFSTSNGSSSAKAGQAYFYYDRGGWYESVAYITIVPPAPYILSLSPTSANQSSGAFTLTLNGTHFTSSSAVLFNGSSRTTTYVSSTQLTVTILASDLSTPGAKTVSISDSTAGNSNSVTFNVNYLTPTITNLSPNPILVTGGDLTITATGTGFASGSVAYTNGYSRSTSVTNATTLTFTIPSFDADQGETQSVTIVNPNPGGGTSNIVALTLNNPVPTLTNLSPTSVPRNSGATTLTATGSNFTTSSTVYFGSTALATTYGSTTSLTAALPAALLTTAGTTQVTVVNPTPAGGPSAALTFSTTNPVPTLTGISPTSAVAPGATRLPITLTGTNFISDTTIQVTGAYTGNSPQTYSHTLVSSTKITFTLDTNALASGDTLTISAVTPAPGGGTASTTFTVTNPTPTLISISPTVAMLGSSTLVLTVAGTNFTGNSTVYYGTTALATTYTGTSEVSATLPSTALSTAGAVTVTVQNPAPGGGTTEHATFTVLVPVTVNTPVQAGDTVTVTFAWSGPPDTPRIDCGTSTSQVVAGTSGTCRYTTAGEYTIVGSYQAGGTTYSTNPTTVTIPRVAPEGIQLRLTALDGQTNPTHDTSGTTPVVQMATAPGTYPVAVTIEAALTRPTGQVGILDALVLANTTLSAQPTNSGTMRLASSSTLPVETQPTSTSVRSSTSLSNIAVDSTNSTTWGVTLTVAGVTDQGTTLTSDLLLTGPRGDGTTITTDIIAVSPISPYPPATYKYTLASVSTPTANEPYTRAWGVDQNATPLVTSLENNTLTVTFTEGGTKTITLGVDGLFAGSTTWTDTVEIPDIPAAGPIAFTVSAPTYNRPPATYRFTPIWPTLNAGEKVSGDPTWTADGVTIGMATTLTYGFTTAGTFTIGASALTSLGRQITGEQTVTVDTNQVPIGSISCASSYLNKTVSPRQYVLYCKAVNTKDPDGRITGILWGIPSLGISQSGNSYLKKVFTAPAVLPVTLTLTDNSGGTAVLETTADLTALQ